MKKSTIIRKIKRALKQYNIKISFDNYTETIFIYNLNKFDSELENRISYTFDLNYTNLFFNQNKKTLIIEY